jgi:hypothetical protein
MLLSSFLVSIATISASGATLGPVGGHPLRARRSLVAALLALTPISVHSLSNHRQDSRAFLIAVGVVMHYANKYVELLDTVFIVLRKKTQQLSYLHMYHHVRRSSSQSTWC